MPVHLLAQQLAAEALLRVVVCGPAAGRRRWRLAERTGSRGRGRALALHEGAHPLPAGHRLAPHGSSLPQILGDFMVTSPGSASPAATSTALIKRSAPGRRRARSRRRRSRAAEAGRAQAYLAQASTSSGSGRSSARGAVALDLTDVVAARLPPDRRRVAADAGSTGRLRSRQQPDGHPRRLHGVLAVAVGAPLVGQVLVERRAADHDLDARAAWP